MTSFWYMASPYSKFPGGIELAYEAACEQAAVLIRAGVKVFSPIAHSHPIASLGNIDPMSHAIWMAVDEPFAHAARGIIVCCLPTWEESYGIGIEIAQFRKAGKPIVYMQPGEVPDAVRP